MAARSINKLNILTFGVKAVFIALFFLMAITFLIMVSFSYEQVTSEIMSAYGKVERLDIFRSRYLTQARYAMAKIIAGSIMLVLSLVILKLNKFTSVVSLRIISWGESFLLLRKYLLEYYDPMSRIQKIIFWIIIVVMSSVKWFFMHRYYFQNDELFSYLFFVRKGLMVLCSYYPGPNNHIFYSLLAYFTQIFSLSPFYVMKLPSFVAGSIAPVFLFLFLKRYYSFSISIIGILLFSFSIHFFYYSLFGRGYVLMTFLSIFAFFMSLEIMEGKNERFLWHTYAAATILGFYTLPSYLYTFVSFAGAIGLIMIIQKRIDQIKTYFYYHLVITFIVLVLYSPIVFISGVASLTSNPWVARLKSEDFFMKFPEMIKNMFGYLINLENGAVWFSLLLFILVGWILIKARKISLALILGSLFILPVIMLLIQRVNPFDRVWTYLILPYSICLMIPVDYFFKFLEEYKTVRLVATSVIVTGIVSYTIFYFYNDTNHGHMIYDEVSRISVGAIKESNGKIYTNEDLYNLYIRYESSRMGNEIIPDMVINSDLPNYSHLLLIPGSSFPEAVRKEDYLLKEQNSYIEVYKLK